MLNTLTKVTTQSLLFFLSVLLSCQHAKDFVEVYSISSYCLGFGLLIKPQFKKYISFPQRNVLFEVCDLDLHFEV